MRYRISIRLIIVIVIVLAYSVSSDPTIAQKDDRINASSAARIAPAFPPIHTWETIVNNSFPIPNTDRYFSSYGQPSVNVNGTVVFRARSTMGGHETGMYMKHRERAGIIALADLHTFVPEPNNLGTLFREFSAFPRIAMNSDYSAFRGLHSPVYRYFLPDDTETRAGTTGIYVAFDQMPLMTGASKLGVVPGFEHFSVPGFKNQMFDVFPGGAAINDEGTIVYKANWTEDVVNHKTGIFSRQLLTGPMGGYYMTKLLASSDTEIPNVPPMLTKSGFAPMTFDSTSPPTVVGNDAVFLGLDYELDPHYGGIYRVGIDGGDLEPLVEIGKVLPNTKTSELIRLGEGLSFDGNYLAFWAAWGHQFKTIRLNCPEDGNRDLLAYCNGIDPNSILDRATGQWYQLHQVPVEQGIVVMDVKTREVWVVANTNENFNDFTFWTYSGHVPGSDGDDDAEPPRWRSAAFMTVSGGAVVFKARTATMNDRNEYINVIDGLYIADAPANSGINTLVETGMDAWVLDKSLAPNQMPITGLGIEREGFRGNVLAINAAMANEEEGWGGIYTLTFERGINNLKSKVTDKTVK
jgi:hypothetical protein